MKGFKSKGYKYIVAYILGIMLMLGLFSPAQASKAQESEEQSIEAESFSYYNEDMFDSYEEAQAASQSVLDAAGEEPVDPNAIVESQ